MDFQLMIHGRNLILSWMLTNRSVSPFGIQIR